MKWMAYINEKIPEGVKSYKRVFELDCSRSDSSFATLEASKLFNAKLVDILCIPACDPNCEDEYHTYLCQVKCIEGEPLITRYRK